ncbi:MAG TPA: hypothetical protein VFO76_11870 [Candidatus Kapabacteria bacterium]|nr:hypothetical protein [Candidatus Kapabacteria bacterium]
MSLHISKAEDTELAEKAYASVRAVPTVEPNDRNRLGYHIWLYLRGELTSIEEAVRVSRSRFSPKTLPIEDVAAHIQGELKKIDSGLVSITAEGVLA